MDNAQSRTLAGTDGTILGQYGTHVVNGIFVHSVACGQANSYNLPVGEYLRLGNPASHDASVPV